ncbi:MFS transporter [Cupriavidus basilensis]|uniref:MFS transporter n=1 Tax=Cupriavidus basilensis TaxID=68895 RepID=A0ABT6AU12_9BURK|nr:MFS transporter [Cupriavidus basilensis]MDF3835873.1 MFS transporter [Cupriavidus basilensis]
MKPHPHTLAAGLPTLTWLQFLTSLVDWMLLVFLQLMVFQLTGSAFNIMLLVLCELVPMLLLGAWAGAIVDRMKLNRVLFWSCAARLLVSFALLVQVVRGELGALYVIAALGAACNRFFSPAASALLPRMASESALQRANALIMGVRMGGMAAGTVLAGVLASRYSLDLVAILIGVLLLLAGVCCLLLPAVVHTPSTDPEQGILDDLREAIARFGGVSLVPLAASVLVTLALGSFEILALVYVSQVLGRTSSDVGLLFGAYGLGMLGGLLLSSWRGAMPRYGQVMVASLFLMCLSTWALAQIDSLMLALVLVTMAGVAEGLVLSLSLLRLYTSVPNAYCARVVALLDTATAASFLLAVLVTGAVADIVPATALLEYMSWIFASLLLLGIGASRVGTRRRASNLGAKEAGDA